MALPAFRVWSKSTRPFAFHDIHLLHSQRSSLLHPFYLQSTSNIGTSRQFSSSSPACMRKVKARPPPTKKQIAAKERKRALKLKKKDAYDNEKLTLADAINVLRAVEVTRPNSTFELVVRTEMKRATAVPKGRISLPREPKTQTKDRILVFADGKQAEEAKRAGAEFVGGTELIDGVINGKFPATLFLCTPALIRAITPRLGRILGPRGLMPSERRGTVTDDIVGYFRKIQGSSEWKGDKAGDIRTAIGKLNFPTEDVVKNVRHFVDTVKLANNTTAQQTARQKEKNAKPPTVITKVVLSSTHGPGIQISDV